MNLEAYEAYREVASKKVKDYSVKLAELAGKRGVLTNLIIDYTEVIAKCKEVNSFDTGARHIELQKKIEDTQAIMDDIALKLGDARKDEPGLLAHIDMLNQQCKKATAEIITYGSKKQALVNRSEKLVKMKESITFTTDSVNKCPLCYRVMDEEAYANFQKSIEQEQAQIDDDILEVHLSLDPARVDKSNADSAIAFYSSKLQELRSTISAYEMQIRNGEYIVATCVDEIKQLLLPKEDTTATEAMMIDKIKAAEAELLEIEENTTELSALREAYGFWEEAFSDTGMKNILFDSVMPVLNSLSNKYLQRFSGGRMSIEIGTVSETKKGDLKDRIKIMVTVDGFTKYYVDCSGGEERLVDVSNMFALRDLALSTSKSILDVMFCDEVFDWIDDKGKDRVMEYLREMAKDSLVFVVSHSSELKSRFRDGEIITVKKIKGKGSEVIR